MSTFMNFQELKKCDICLLGVILIFLFPQQLIVAWSQYNLILREFLKTMFSRCMLYRHNAAIGTD